MRSIMTEYDEMQPKTNFRIQVVGSCPCRMLPFSWRHERLDATAPEEPDGTGRGGGTRDALIDAALELFEAKGYEHTAVHEITDAVTSLNAPSSVFREQEDVALHS